MDLEGKGTPDTIALTGGVRGNILSPNGDGIEKPREKPVGERDLRVNVAWTFLGNVVYAACQWGLLVVLAKIGTPEMVGQLALALAVTAPVIMFCNLEMRVMQATDARADYSFGHYLRLRLFTTALALVVIAALATLSGRGYETVLVILIIALAKACECISDIFYGLQQKNERMERIAISLMARGALSLGAFAVAVYLTHSLVWAAVALAAVWR